MPFNRIFVSLTRKEQNIYKRIYELKFLKNSLRINERRKGAWAGVLKLIIYIYTSKNINKLLFPFLFIFYFFQILI